MTTPIPFSFEIGDLRASFLPAVLTNKWVIDQCITETHSLKQDKHVNASAKNRLLVQTVCFGDTLIYNPFVRQNSRWKRRV